MIKLVTGGIGKMPFMTEDFRGYCLFYFILMYNFFKSF
jgi:hypothetical protein